MVLHNRLAKDAIFSPCRGYRYALIRLWDEESPQAMFIGLNPSTADETQDDPTIRRCVRFARDWGCGGLAMLNAYAFRTTNPKEILTVGDPVGPCNDAYLRAFAATTNIIVAAWGVHCSARREEVICKAINRPIHCLGVTKAGRPKHPLYLRADTLPQPFWQPPA